MNDFNRDALPVPCLRLDYGFGEQWASVELGDGTGYVRLADYEMVKAENAKLLELENIRMSQVRFCEDLDRENAKLRELVRKYGEYTDQDRCEGCVCKSRCNDGEIDECWQLTEIRALARELGIEV